MSALELIKALEAALALSSSLASLYDQVRETMSETERGEVEKALQALQAKNDANHVRLQAKLRGA